MHLLAATPGSVEDGSDAIDLGQTPGDIVLLTAADTDISAFALAQASKKDESPDFPDLRIANFLRLSHNMSVDVYVDDIVAKSRFVICRLLGGRAYWTYGVDEIATACKVKNIPLAFIPGDTKPDPELRELSTVSAEAYDRLSGFFKEGGPANCQNCLAYVASLLGYETDWLEPSVMPNAGLYAAGMDAPGLQDLPLGTENNPAGPKVALLFYKALVQSGDLSVIDTMINALGQAGLNAVPIFCGGLKDPISAAVIESVLDAAKPDVIVNTMGFSVSQPGVSAVRTPFDGADCPVLQVVLSASSRSAWEEGTKGLATRDIAMNVALPEVDGRVLTRAISFKGSKRWDPLVEADLVTHEPAEDRCQFVAELCSKWASLRRTPVNERRVGIILANYPNRDGRMGNGVGLDTPNGTLSVLRSLADEGYSISVPFKDGDALIKFMGDGPTNAATEGRDVRETFSLDLYQRFFDSLPAAVRLAVTGRWGPIEDDPFFLKGRCAFALPVFTLGNVAVGLQPARGYNIDPVQSYHDPALVPPHGYIAFYAWMRKQFDAHALIHFGKHGTLEWLPGKSTGLSEACYPEAVLGPMPHLYPFIVNDPGEGTQAKRRAQAVIIDHLTPPLTRAESYGPLQDLERLVDEYYDASQGDPRRLRLLRREILELTQSSGLDKDIGIQTDGDPEEALEALDNHLCELKEMQIRDGLHIFGMSPQGRLSSDLIMALLRVPRGTGPEDQSILRAISNDLVLKPGFDPLDADMGVRWSGKRPRVLGELVDQPWRSEGDTIERLEAYGSALVEGRISDVPGPETAAVLSQMKEQIRPAVEACGDAELAGLLRGLSGRFVPAGPSGAPSRGRPEVLPTGRNFYSVDTRAVPTPAAWSLGWKSAQMLVERHAQDNGDYPRAMAISVWGTSNMRTGGDDIAQILALMGVRPTWDQQSYRMTGFEILPQDLLDRPRVDVTVRISGFFRDAFPGLIDLVDSATRAVAALDEPDRINPLAQTVRERATELQKREGLDEAEAFKRAARRIYGSLPGGYGAGMQALMDEGGWRDDQDLAQAYVSWGGYAYGSGNEGSEDQTGLVDRLKTVEAVVQNQDNREHDLLDSDDYFQFEGGMTAAVRHFSGKQPDVYHNDHSRPESPRIRTLQEEIGRVVRARVVNPKWIQGVMRHGYKGAFEMAATVDYLVSFAATARAVSSHHFDLVHEAYLEDDTVLDFLKHHNPDALREMVARLIDAQDRGLWNPRRNSTRETLERLHARPTP